MYSFRGAVHCFWHGHTGCKYFVIPKTRKEWWLNKIDNTKKKDVENIKKLKKTGWNVIVVWECQLQSRKKDKTLENLSKKIKMGI